MKQESIAIFAKGCFWDVEKHFSNIRGVISTRCGYTGGFIPHPSHMEITGEKTGHVHAVKISFDPNIISYEDLLDIYISIPFAQSTPPTYFQSIIFYANEEQRSIAIKKTQNLPYPVLIKNVSTFYPASEFHQHHWQKNILSKHLDLLP